MHFLRVYITQVTGPTLTNSIRVTWLKLGESNGGRAETATLNLVLSMRQPDWPVKNIPKSQARKPLTHKGGEIYLVFSTTSRVQSFSQSNCGWCNGGLMAGSPLAFRVHVIGVWGSQYILVTTHWEGQEQECADTPCVSNEVSRPEVVSKLLQALYNPLELPCLASNLSILPDNSTNTCG